MIVSVKESPVALLSPLHCSKWWRAKEEEEEEERGFSFVQADGPGSPESVSRGRRRGPRGLCLLPTRIDKSLIACVEEIKCSGRVQSEASACKSSRG